MNRTIASYKLVSLALLLHLCAACGPIALTPVPQPITCYCSGTTVVIRGQLEETRGGVAQQRPMDLVMETSPERLKLSFYDAQTAEPLCVLWANLQGTWSERQICKDLIDPTGSTPLSMERGSLSYQHDMADLRFDAAAQGAAVSGHFSGNTVVVDKGK